MRSAVGVQEELAELRRRLAAGELEPGHFGELRAALLAGLTPEEQSRLSEVLGSGPRGPSGVAGQAVRTQPPALIELNIEIGSVLFDHWRIRRELGRGGFGVVFEAEDLRLGQLQAVKILDPAMVAREDLLIRFRREVRVMRGLHHRHIVRVFDYCEDLEHYLALISMELVAAGSVAQLLARAPGRSLRLPLVLAILRQILSALQGAHAAGVIHRDVTPSNVLLAGADSGRLITDPGADPDVRLVDFGIAGMMETSELSRKSRVLGTAAYLAPEVLAPDGEITPRVDVYGAGAMTYELLTGRTPVVTGYKAVERLRGGMPSALAELVMGMVAAAPGERLSLAEASVRLETLLADRAVEVAAKEPSRASPPAHERGATEARMDPPIMARSEDDKRSAALGMPYWLKDFDNVEVSKPPRATGRFIFAGLLTTALAASAWFVLHRDAASAMAQLEIRSNVAGGSVTIDGLAYGATPVRKALEAGPHRVVVTKPGCDDYVEIVELAPAASIVRTARLICPPSDARKPPVVDSKDDGRRVAVPARDADEAHLDASQVRSQSIVATAHVSPASASGVTYSSGHVRRDSKHTPVRLVLSPQPEYTEEARRARVQGIVRLKVMINSRGRVVSVGVDKGLPLGLTEAAVKAVKTWIYEPATLDGRPVEVFETIEVKFSLP